MAPVRSYTNWNSRTTDEEEQIEPYRKYFFICEGANTETWYFKKLIEVEMKAELYSFLLENKFKNGVMYIKSMHEFVVKYDMAESVEEESLMRGFQRWRKKMKKE